MIANLVTGLARAAHPSPHQNEGRPEFAHRLEYLVGPGEVESGMRVRPRIFSLVRRGTRQFTRS